ncbi:MAG TPA: zinc ribbon domain-containing protein [Rhodanobacteraceae bacterium]|nr:zinc ribbon domain-containing protein [Rhodanobacteraceae bacterium]
MSTFSELQQAAAAAEAESAGPVRSKWRCVKCAHPEAEIGQSRQAGSALAAIFDIEGLKFTRVTCARCGFTEFYRKPASLLMELFDFSIG